MSIDLSSISQQNLLVTNSQRPRGIRAKLHIQADFINLPFLKKGLFDIIFSNMALDYTQIRKDAGLSNPVYKEIYDRLKPGGLFVATLHHPTLVQNNRHDNLYAESIWEHWRSGGLFLSQEEIEEFLQKIGFVDIEVEEIKSNQGAEFFYLLQARKPN